MNREVKSDAKKIWIVAPIPCKYEKKVVEDDEEKTEIISYNRYRYVYVYDISQTEGDEIPLEDKKPEVNKLKQTNIKDLYYMLQRFSKVPVIEKELFGGVKGYYSEKRHEIAIKQNLSTDEKVGVLIHELTHSLYDDFDYSKDRDLSEVFVESVAFIVADHLGLDTSGGSFNYIAGWANGETKKVLELGNKIQKCANQFIDSLENFENEEIDMAA